MLTWLSAYSRTTYPASRNLLVHLARSPGLGLPIQQSSDRTPTQSLSYRPIIPSSHLSVCPFARYTNLLAAVTTLVFIEQAVYIYLLFEEGIPGVLACYLGGNLYHIFAFSQIPGNSGFWTSLDGERRKGWQSPVKSHRNMTKKASFQ